MNEFIKEWKPELYPEKKKALITGINGMDGSYLAELLLEKIMKCLVWNAVHLLKIELIQVTLKVR